MLFDVPVSSSRTPVFADVVRALNHHLDETVVSVSTHKVAIYPPDARHPRFYVIDEQGAWFLEDGNEETIASFDRDRAGMEQLIERLQVEFA
jgi:hypothetical protein